MMMRIGIGTEWVRFKRKRASYSRRRRTRIALFLG
jgi:hypothetical protein